MLLKTIFNNFFKKNDNNSIETLFANADINKLEKIFLQNASDIEIVHGIVIPSYANACFAAAIFVENMSGRGINNSGFITALHVAEQLLRRAINNTSFWKELYSALGINLWFQGRYSESIDIFSQGEKARDEMAIMAGWQVDSRVYLPRNCTEVLGLMGHIDGFLKYKFLSGDERPYYLLAGPQNIVNPAYLEYWKKYIHIITDPKEIAKHSVYEKVYGVNWNWVMPKNDKFALVHEGLAVAQGGWQSEARAPLLILNSKHKNFLTLARINWGMSESDKFVCLHVRSAGFYGTSNENAQKFRNTSIELYYPLIKTLTNLGFWVIRMGDPSMPPLDMLQCGNPGLVVDYALSFYKSSELDVALCSECELFISTNSGLHALAYSSGRKVCGVNYPINSGIAWQKKDIFIPQLYYSKEKNRILTFEEILGTDLVHCNHHFLFDRAGINLIPNEPEDITEAILEALSPNTYITAKQDLAIKVRAHFTSLSKKYEREILGRLGSHYAAKYAKVLAPSF